VTAYRHPARAARATCIGMSAEPMAREVLARVGAAT